MTLVFVLEGGGARGCDNTKINIHGCAHAVTGTATCLCIYQSFLVVFRYVVIRVVFVP